MPATETRLVAITLRWIQSDCFVVGRSATSLINKNNHQHDCCDPNVVGRKNAFITDQSRKGNDTTDVVVNVEWKGIGTCSVKTISTPISKRKIVLLIKRTDWHGEEYDYPFKPGVLLSADASAMDIIGL